ncbi:MAG: hypothetical protein IJP96_06935 [Synergistaceae bacterium]|nr:hypothetical protein [Synergistaceae bacterium]
MNFNLRFHKALSGRKRNGGVPAAQSVPLNELENVKPTSEYASDVEKHFEDAFKEYQSDTGKAITEEDMLKLEKQMQDLTNSDEVYIGIRFNMDDMEKIVLSGRFKSQFEIGSSHGLFDPGYRMEVEEAEMGYSKNLKAQDRPIYGMLFEAKDLSKMQFSNLTSSEHYGDAVAIFKHDVKKHATVTFDDSLDSYIDSRLYPSSLLNPSRHSISTDAVHRVYNTIKGGKKVDLKNLTGLFSYAEVQIHNRQATVSNIERIIFPKGIPSFKLPLDVLEENDISWSIEK